MLERFKAQRVITDSGRTKRWVVIDQLHRLPGWEFNRHDAPTNERNAEEAARLLNGGWYAAMPETRS